VVGDAHKLSQYFADEKFDAVFSLSVFEHLAMPWIVAREINRVLDIGGITFHSTHFSWPVHEIPWDFYRFSDEGLKVLFAPVLGYKILHSGFFQPVRMSFNEVVPGHEDLPFHQGFGGVSILAEKTYDVDCKKFNWDATIEEILDKESHYPKTGQ
jgi:SAM-dependent methyltransferase